MSSKRRIKGCFTTLEIEEEEDIKDHCCAVNIVKHPKQHRPKRE